MFDVLPSNRFGNERYLNLLQFPNTLLPMLVTLSGIVTDVNPEP